MKSLKDKIFRAIVAVSLTGLVLTGLCAALALYGSYRDLALARLDDELQLAATGVETEGITYLDKLPEENFRLTWIAEDGSVLYDSVGSTQSHKNRQEFIEAEKEGFAHLERYSDTLMEKTIYLACRLEDGTVLRISQTQHAALAWLLELAVPLIILFAVILVLSVFISRKLAKRIISPLNELDLDDPLKHEIYPEILPVADRLAGQYALLAEKEKSLDLQKAEFESVISCMNEAFILFQIDGTILSANRMARDLFDLDHLPDKGKFEKDGRIWHVNIEPVTDDCQVLLAYDITADEQLALSRKMFTANVSHELKTPLQTILGSSELLENGLVSQRDVPDFGHMIHDQATSLLSQISDILRLSQLDELEAVEKREVDLNEIIRQEVRNIEPAARKKNITVEVNASDVRLFSDERLLHEIMRNLLSNAVKYGKAGGHTLVKADEKHITVTDDGIGIPAVDLPHVFERFYRVDKSRSPNDGSTGLGLSIVYHAAMALGARIDVKSVPGKGSTFEVVLDEG